MQEINEIGNVHDRISQMVDHFCRGNKTAFGRGANIQSGVLAGIVAGRRNKPSFEVLQKILTGYADVSPDWLLFGRGEMMRDRVGVMPSLNITKFDERVERQPIGTREEFEENYKRQAVEWARLSKEVAQWEKDHELLVVLAQYVANQDASSEFATRIRQLLPSPLTPLEKEEVELAKQLREQRQRALLKTPTSEKALPVQ